MKNLHFAQTEIKSGFWKFYEDLVRNVTVHRVYDRFHETGRFSALSCNWKDGEPNAPHIFYDSDTAKWLEGAAYLIETKADPELEALIDESIAQIVKNQRADGYFNSYFLTVEPAKIFTDRCLHELYCTGHLIEAAIAYDKATGKDALLRCMKKSVDYIYRVFVEEQSAHFVTPGHEEIELALIKLYEYTGNEKALKLARFFIDQRGSNDKEAAYFDQSDVFRAEKMYTQSNVPVREIKHAVGHAVRACYLYTAMAMMAGVDNDTALKAACDRVWKDILTTKMGITGGIGAEPSHEAFSFAYDIPNTNTYNETCAAIALAMFAGEMQQLEKNSAYGDVIERVYYNGFLSGLSIDGERFFYTNPLEIDLKKNTRPHEYHPIADRVKIFGCSCCPPNVVRMLASLPRYMHTVDGDTIYCNMFADSVTNLTIGGKPATLTQKTEYPFDGKIVFTYQGESATLCVRIPDWCVEYTGETINGFAEFSVKDGDSVTVDLPMNIHFVEANPNVQDNAGRYAVTRGPLVYCMEGVDNGENLRDITLLENGNVRVETEDWLPAPVIYIDAERRETTKALYQLKTGHRQAFTAKLIPYFSFNNRGVTDMLIWTMVK